MKTRLLEYLPDQTEMNEKSVQRSYLFNIVNTLDSTYFPQLIDEVEHLNASGGAKKEFVEVDSKLQKLLESVYSKAKSSGGKRALGILKVNASKRKAPIARKSGLTQFKTELDPASHVDDRPRDYIELLNLVG